MQVCTRIPRKFGVCDDDKRPPLRGAATADQIIPIVKHNLGIGFVPEQFLYDEPNGIYRLNLKDRIPTREICVVTRKGHSPSLAARELGKMMLEE